MQKLAVPLSERADFHKNTGENNTKREKAKGNVPGKVQRKRTTDIDDALLGGITTRTSVNTAGRE